MMKPKIGVLAGSKKQFEEFLHDVSSQNKDIYIFISSEERIRGCVFIDVIAVGTYWGSQYRGLDLIAYQQIRNK